VKIVFADPGRLARARYLLREHGIAVIPTSPAYPDGPQVTFLELEDADARKAVEILSDCDLMGTAVG